MPDTCFLFIEKTKVRVRSVELVVGLYDKWCDNNYSKQFSFFHVVFGECHPFRFDGVREDEL